MVWVKYIQLTAIMKISLVFLLPWSTRIIVEARLKILSKKSKFIGLSLGEEANSLSTAEEPVLVTFRLIPTDESPV
jgi:hypothetical protein